MEVSFIFDNCTYCIFTLYTGIYTFSVGKSLILSIVSLKASDMEPISCLWASDNSGGGCLGTCGAATDVEDVPDVESSGGSSGGFIFLIGFLVFKRSLSHKPVKHIMNNNIKTNLYKTIETCLHPKVKMQFVQFRSHT